MNRLVGAWDDIPPAPFKGGIFDWPPSKGEFLISPLQRGNF